MPASPRFQSAHRATRCTAFAGQRMIASGVLAEVALAAREVVERGEAVPVLVFDDSTGRPIDVDYRGTAEEVLARIPRRPRDEGASDGEPEARGRGRPKLGVESREVTLLPRHWEWLATQPGGASATLRRLVEEARRGSGDRDRIRAAQEAAYRFMSAMAGDAPGFEEATRALFAGDGVRFAELVAAWPPDVRDHAAMLAADAIPR